jgi:hypothetical protein
MQIEVIIAYIFESIILEINSISYFGKEIVMDSAMEGSYIIHFESECEFRLLPGRSICRVQD